MTKLAFLTALPPHVRQVALQEISQILQKKHGNRFTLTDQDFADYEAGTTKQEPTDEEIDNILKNIM